MEDKESCATDIFLEENGNVVVGDGDGPIPIKSSGTWSQEMDGSFFMSITRTFGGGLEVSSSTCEERARTWLQLHVPYNVSCFVNSYL